MRCNGNTVMYYRKTTVFPGIFNVFIGIATIGRTDIYKRSECRQSPCLFLLALYSFHCFKFGRREVSFLVVCFCQVHSSSSSKLPKLSPADASATRGRSNSGNGCCSIQPFTKATASCNLSFGMRNVSSS